MSGQRGPIKGHGAMVTYYQVPFQYLTGASRNKIYYQPELQKRADRADQSVLFFVAGANFWEKHVKNRRKHAKTGENTQKQAKNRRFFGANFFGGKIGRC